jgi:hypothetical protein
MMSTMSDFPEHEKLVASIGMRQTIQGFLEWLTTTRSIELVIADARGLRTLSTPDPDTLVLEYLGIDAEKLELEEGQLADPDGWLP